jgi:GT2 family glycosyltransferase
MWERAIDVCITTYNRNHRLVETLDILSKQTNQSFNVIINDDGSGSLIDPNQYPVVTKYIWNKDDGYHRVARFNESVSLCVSPYIILLDDDSVPNDEYFIQHHIDALNQHEVSQGSVRFGNGKFATGWFSTANIALRRSLIQRVGLFEFKFDGFYGGEDVDLGIKLKNLGVDVYYNQVAQVNHSDPMYLNGDRSPKIVGHAETIFFRKNGFILDPKKNIFSRIWKKVRFGIKRLGKLLGIIKY